MAKSWNGTAGVLGNLPISWLISDIRLAFFIFRVIYCSLEHNGPIQCQKPINLVLEPFTEITIMEYPSPN